MDIFTIFKKKKKSFSWYSQIRQIIALWGRTNVIIFGPIDDARDSLIDESDLNMPRETMELLFSRQQHTIRWKRPCV